MTAKLNDLLRQRDERMVEVRRLGALREESRNAAEWKRLSAECQAASQAAQNTEADIELVRAEIVRLQGLQARYQAQLAQAEHLAGLGAPGWEQTCALVQRQIDLLNAQLLALVEPEPEPA